MKVRWLIFLNIMLGVFFIPYAYSAAGSATKTGNFSSEALRFKGPEQKNDTRVLRVPSDSCNSSDDSVTTCESEFGLSDDTIRSERSLSLGSEDLDMTFDNNYNRSVDGNSDNDGMKSNSEAQSRRRERARGVNQGVFDHDVKKMQDVQKRGKEWLASKRSIFNAINVSIVFLINELKKISETQERPINTSLYLIEGYKDAYDYAIAMYEDFLNGTSGDLINEDVLIEKTEELINEMLWSIDHILSCLDQDDVRKYKGLSPLKDNVKKWEATLKSTSHIRATKGFSFKEKISRYSGSF